MKRETAGGWVVLLLTAACGASPAWAAEESENAACIKCHREKTPGFDETIVAGSAHGKLDCTECHPSDETYPHPKTRKHVNCSVCHEDARKAFAKGIHAELAKKGELDLPTCTACHGTHGIHKKSDPRSLVNHQRVDEACLKCHASAEIKARHPNMPDPALLAGYRQSVHGRAVHLKGLSVAATCTDCHGHHEIRPKDDPASPANRANVPKTCSHCHTGIFADFEKSTHGQLWKQGDARGPVCSVCHKPHEIKEVATAAFQLKSPGECGTCHKDQVSTYRDTFHGKATSLGYVVAAKCSDCHTAHRNLPADHPDSTVNPAHLPETCGNCHSGANAKFVRYDPHADPRDVKRSPWVYYVDHFMKLLLFFTFGFFGIHTALWLQRSIAAYFRKEYKRIPDSGPYVRRFSPTSVVLHVIVVVSFLGLAATGLPLKYSFAGWAKVLGQVLGGLEVTRFFHRVFALATFGYFFYHLGQLVHQVVIKRQFKLLRGPNSMVPQFQDLVDFFQTLRWFLYLGPKPRLEKWTYFEKFDYFAVFWGVPILGGSGLLMWFPGLVSRVLPGTVLNVATVVHSEEALLAAGFIFTFHFYHNHLRLENFPLDTTIFTGRMPLERLKEERPAEYERLSRENRLGEILCDAPPAPVSRKSKVFGYIALVIGLLLIFAIFFAHFLG